MSNLPPFHSDEDFFSALGLGTPHFNLDSEKLTQAYHALQRTYHPDKHRQSTEEVRQLALMHSMRIAEAFKTLKEPLPRAEYLLSLHGHAVQKAKPSPALLEKIFMQREFLEQASSDADLKIIAEGIAKEKQTVIEQFQTHFTKHHWQEALEAALLWRYLEKAEAEAHAKLKT